jgi:hypothetical protein
MSAELKSLAHPEWPYTGTPHEWRGFQWGDLKRSFDRFEPCLPLAERNKLFAELLESVKAEIASRRRASGFRAQEPSMSMFVTKREFEAARAIYQKQKFGPELT